jgi:hypothetical protein
MLGEEGAKDEEALQDFIFAVGAVSEDSVVG